MSSLGNVCMEIHEFACMHACKIDIKFHLLDLANEPL